MSSLNPEILKVLEKAVKKDPENELSVFSIAEKIDRRAGWVARALVELAKEGKVIRTRDGDEDGRGPFYRLLTLDTVPEPEKEKFEPFADYKSEPGAIPIIDHETGRTTIVPPSHAQVSYTVPPLNVVVPSPSGPLLRPMVFLQEVEGFAERAGFTVKYVEFMPDEIIVKLISEKASKTLLQRDQ